MNSSQRIVFFVEWDATFVEFIKGISLSPTLRGNIVVHIFYRHDIPAKVLPRYKPWLFKHPASSENIDAAWRLLEAYVTRYKFDSDYSLTADVDKKRPKTSESFYSRGGSTKSSSERSRSGIISVPSCCFSYYVICQNQRKTASSYQMQFLKSFVCGSKLWILKLHRLCLILYNINVHSVALFLPGKENSFVMIRRYMD